MGAHGKTGKGGIPTILKEHLTECLSIALAHDLGEARDNALRLLLGIALGSNLNSENVGGGKSVVVLEVVHKVVSNRRLWGSVQLDIVHDDLGLEIGNVDIVVNDKLVN